jgi:cellulose synthase/poly-beta-1,6-N-acetylglucosamine synthase-like glycosyltransferase
VLSTGWFVAAIAVAVLFAGWFLYPGLLAVVARFARPHRAAGIADHAVSVVIATREAPELVAARVANLVNSDYPAELLQIVVAVDRDSLYGLDSYAFALPVARESQAEFLPIDGSRATLKLVRAQDAAGKAAALDCGVRAATHPIIVFTDSAQRFERDALRRLVAYLDDPRFGAVSGRLTTPHDEERGSVLGAFWSYETLLRKLEARVHSIVAVTGAIYAMRRSLWRRPPAGLICDDLYVPLQVVRNGFRVGYCDDARAHDPREFTGGQEMSRKVRTLTGMIQMCAWQPWILVPWSNPVWLQFVCHKLIRLATPLLAAVAACGVAWELAKGGWLQDVLSGAILGAGLTLVVLDLRRPGAGLRVAQRAWMALRLLFSPLVAMSHALRGNWNVWRPHRVR